MKYKYAIYKNSIGLYYWKYIDSMSVIKGTLLEAYVHKEELPIIVNRVGGKSVFDPEDKSFVEIRECEEDQEPLTREEMYPKNNDNFEFGWIDPEANTYSTEYEEHLNAADMLCVEYGYSSYNGERALEQNGWVKVTGSWKNGVFQKIVFAENSYITKKQADKLYELGLDGCRWVQMYIEHSEDKW